MFLNPKLESRPEIAFKALHTIKKISRKTDRTPHSFAFYSRFQFRLIPYAAFGVLAFETSERF